MYQRGIPATTGHPRAMPSPRRVPLPAFLLVLAFAFLERARLALGLPPETIRDVQRDPGALRRMFGDDALVDFLYLEAGDLEDRLAWVQRARARGGFVREFRDVLTRMEAWR